MVRDKFLLLINMDDASEEKDSFYTETGQIADAGNAYDLAHTEASRGRNDALAQEAKMVQEAENGGLTEQEIFNEGVAALLLEKYPDAFVEVVNNGVKETRLKSYEDRFGYEQNVFKGRSIPGPDEIGQERYNVFSKLQPLLSDISTLRNGDKGSIMFHLLTGYSRGTFLSFSRSGISGRTVTVPGIGDEGLRFAFLPNSLKDFSESDLSLFKRVCEYRNEQQRLNNLENQKREGNKVTLDKLREIL